MLKLLDDNEILMSSTHCKGRSVFGETYIKTLNAKIYTNMAANDSKPYLGHLSKLYRNTLELFC